MIDLESSNHYAFEELLKNNLSSKVDREKRSTGFKDLIADQQRKCTFSQLHDSFFLGGSDDRAQTFINRSRYLLITDIIPVVNSISETKTDQPSSVTLRQGRIVIGGLEKISFAPEQLLAGCLTAEITSSGIEVVYPHLDNAGHMQNKSVLTLQAETRKNVAVKAMEAIVQSVPDFTRTIPTRLEKKHYSWLALRFNQIQEIVQVLGMGEQSEKGLGSARIGAVVTAAWEPDLTRSIDAFNQVYQLISQPPYKLILDYLDCMQMKRGWRIHGKPTP